MVFFFLRLTLCFHARIENLEVLFWPYSSSLISTSVFFYFFYLQFLSVLCYATCEFTRRICPGQSCFRGGSVVEKGLVGGFSCNSDVIGFQCELHVQLYVLLKFSFQKKLLLFKASETNKYAGRCIGIMNFHSDDMKTCLNHFCQFISH